MKTLIFLSVLFSFVLVGCERDSRISDETLQTITHWSFVAGYFKGHKDAKEGIEISNERAEKLGGIYAKPVNS